MKGGFEISAPPIVNDFGLPAIIPFLLAAATAYLFWNSVVPRQLRGLQVAFQTGEKRYEVHNVTRSVEDARNLLQTKGMRFGVTSYLFALTGVLILVFEFLMTKYGVSEGYHAASIIIALSFIAIPAIISSGSSLGAQVVKPIGAGKATLQNSDIWQNYSYVNADPELVDFGQRHCGNFDIHRHSIIQSFQHLCFRGIFTSSSRLWQGSWVFLASLETIISENCRWRSITFS